MAEEREYVCEICGKRFTGKRPGRALAGHMWFAHMKRVGLKARLEERIRTLEEEKAELEKRMRGLEEENGKLWRENLRYEKECVRLRDEIEKVSRCPVCREKWSEHVFRDGVWVCPQVEWAKKAIKEILEES